jgi:hypothetical protein
MRLSLGTPESGRQQVRHLLSLWGDPLVGTNGRHAAEARKSWPEGDPVAVAMIGLLDVELRRRGCAWAVVEEGLVEVTGAHRGRWPLAALRRRLEASPKADWPELVEVLVLARVDPSGFYAAAVSVPPGDHDSEWASVRGRIRARLFGGLDADSATLAGIEHRFCADGLVEVLELAPTSHLREPAGVRWYRPEEGPVAYGDLGRWKVTAREAYRTARDNVRREGLLETRQLESDGVRVTVVQGGSGYAPTHAFWLPDYVPVDGNGALVVIPNRGLFAAHPVRGPEAVTAAEGLLRLAKRQYDTGPGPVSDQLFWWRDGVLHRQGSRRGAEGIRFEPSDELADVLRALAR